ncbi:hypothetical protein COT78_01840 [Candidatus Berkelbacteria bacterium CG10_big_fil_rev_8_21_14_0_10_43_13]|uniref:Uncharacterized protein n=1 Tax=Candidatus Berkelbacteria bacterium CG10_big_fil_rev_8_21_14_0_10_43_13 TaxID=1974514 RepID=A0A2H0W6Q0_9BACT|nr:MAG: hypothetical protein COT78_01840 [Candidatus Berkelbacteria bacterium CG10_big_fil_rev_8_21_14_0_10_43_13]
MSSANSWRNFLLDKKQDLFTLDEPRSRDNNISEQAVMAITLTITLDIISVGDRMDFELLKTT